jgi:hypothetical protein
MVSAMRIYLVVARAGDRCPPKLYHQPYIFICSVSTPIAVRAFAPFQVFKTHVHADSSGIRRLSVCVSVSAFTVRHFQYQIFLGLYLSRLMSTGLLLPTSYRIGT